MVILYLVLKIWRFFFIYFYSFLSKGKTTLLKHIANRALNIPPNIDVLLCEQGMSPFPILHLMYKTYSFVPD